MTFYCYVKSHLFFIILEKRGMELSQMFEVEIIYVL